MKITVTLDEDIALALRNLGHERKSNQNELVNEALRLGLVVMRMRPKRKMRYRTQSVDMGAMLIDSIDQIGDAHAVAEGTGFK